MHEDGTLSTAECESVYSCDSHTFASGLMLLSFPELRVCGSDAVEWRMGMALALDSDIDSESYGAEDILHQWLRGVT